MHHSAAGFEAAHIADIELNLMGHFGIAHLILMAHIILFLLVAAKNADFLDISVKKRRSTALPKDPVPPVISKVLSLKIDIIELL